MEEPFALVLLDVPWEYDVCSAALDTAVGAPPLVGWDHGA
jgi:hypothetical protein